MSKPRGWEDRQEKMGRNDGDRSNKGYVSMFGLILQLSLLSAWNWQWHGSNDVLSMYTCSVQAIPHRGGPISKRFGDTFWGYLRSEQPNGLLFCGSVYESQHARRPIKIRKDRCLPVFTEAQMSFRSKKVLCRDFTGELSIGKFSVLKWHENYRSGTINGFHNRN